MLEQLKYVNHLGEVLNFGDWNGFFVNSNELHDFEWKTIAVNDRISGFERGIQKKSIPVRILCSSGREGMALRNTLFEIPEKDVLSQEYGRLWINGYYCDCYVTSSKKARYSIDGKYMETDLVIETDRPYWVKETTVYFEGLGEDAEITSEDLDFPYEFPHDYKVSTYRKNELDNTGFYDSRFRMIINGSVVNPTIYINDHMYQVNVTVDDGEFLTIDCASQTIYLTRADGEIVNTFDARNRDNYIFQPIVSGKQTVLWDNSFDFSIILLEERGEPKWDFEKVTEDWDYTLENGAVIETTPTGEFSGYTFSLVDGKLVLNQAYNYLEGVDFAINDGRLSVTYG